MHLYDLFKEYYKSPPTTRVRILKGKPIETIRFTSRQKSCFTQLHILFYSTGKKIVPLNIGEFLTPMGLAYWAMDDGNKQGSGFHLNTHGFTQEEVNLLSKVLLEKFNLINSIQYHNNGYRIYIFTESINKFRILVIEHFHESIKYKLY